MARLSAQSSAVGSAATSNGHIRPPPARDTASDGGNAAVVDADEEVDKTEDPRDDSYPVARDPTLVPGGSRDLSFIGLQAFALGSVFAAGLILTTIFLHERSAWWRLPAFATCLSLFHFLEYWTTARYNVPAVRASSFLLFNNGRAYTMAHALATLEIIVSNFYPTYQETLAWPATMAAGLLFIVVGQIVRSVAMAQAGTNFNHQVQTERKEEHVLVSDGIYAYFRHPSYFGFFWWALGTQFMVGNKVCLIGYAIVLWRFFSTRIRAEENYLGRFFGQQYQDYRNQVGTKIPFIP